MLPPFQSSPTEMNFKALFWHFKLTQHRSEYQLNSHVEHLLLRQPVAVSYFYFLFFNLVVRLAAWVCPVSRGFFKWAVLTLWQFDWLSNSC